MATVKCGFWLILHNSLEEKIKDKQKIKCNINCKVVLLNKCPLSPVWTLPLCVCVCVCVNVWHVCVCLYTNRNMNMAHRHCYLVWTIDGIVDVFRSPW